MFNYGSQNESLRISRSGQPEGSNSVWIKFKYYLDKSWNFEHGLSFEIQLH